MTTDEDVYFAGRIADDFERRRNVARGETRPPLLWWTLVFGANLVLPLIWGYGSTSGLGRVGMGIGIAVVFAIGCRVSLRSRAAILPVIRGGGIVAASQFVPILHLVAGLVGVRAAHFLGTTTRGERFGVDTALGGLVATLVTGIILLAVADIIGRLIGLFLVFHAHRGYLPAGAHPNEVKWADPEI